MRVQPIVTACVLAIGFAALGAGPVLAGDTGSAAGAATEAKPKAAKKDPSRRVCRNIIPSGSRLSIRDCRTQADWDRSAEKAQEGALAQQRGPAGRPGLPPQ